MVQFASLYPFEVQLTPTKLPHIWLATAVLLTAAFFRLVWLQDVPAGLAQDEVFDAGMVPFILEGNHALFFREGYGHEPFYHYWSIPFQLLLGDHWLSARLGSVVLGLLVVALTMAWVKREFGPRPAWLTGLGLAISWWPIIFSRIGIRPMSEPLFLLLGVWFFPRRPVVAGLFWGVSLYTYTGARVVLIIPLLWAIYLWFFPRPGQPTWQAAVTMLLVSWQVYAPLGYTLWRDPTLQERLTHLAGPLDSLRNEGDVRPLLQTITATLGVFSVTGDPRWTYTVPNRPLFEPLTALLFHLGLGLALWRWREFRYLGMLTWFGVALLPSALSDQAPSIIRLIGALPLVYLLLAEGVLWVEKQLTWPKGSQAMFYLLLLGLNVWQTGYWGFVYWPQTAEGREKYQTVWLDVARHIGAHPQVTPAVADAYFEELDADAIRRNLGQNPEERWVQTGSTLAGALVYPAGFPAPFWFYVPHSAYPAPFLAQVGQIPAEPVERSRDFVVYDLSAARPEPATPQNLNYQEVLTFEGYTLAPLTAGQPVELITFWRVQNPPPADVRVFIHFLNPAGEILTQHDGWDAPPGHLRPGDVVLQRHLLWPPAEQLLSGERYQLALGVYALGSGARLVYGSPPADYFILPEVVQFTP